MHGGTLVAASATVDTQGLEFILGRYSTGAAVAFGARALGRYRQPDLVFQVGRERVKRQKQKSRNQKKPCGNMRSSY